MANLNWCVVLGPVNFYRVQIKMIGFVIFIFVVLLIAGGLAWWVLRARKADSATVQVPVYDDKSKELLKKYFSSSSTAVITPSTKLQTEFDDALRLVTSVYNDTMLELCSGNTNIQTRPKAIVCAFYKTTKDFNTKPTSVPMPNLFNLLSLYVATKSDGMGLAKRTDLLEYNPANQMVSIKAPKFIEEMKIRARIMVNRKVGVVPNIREQLEASNDKPFVMAVDSFLYTMLETFIRIAPAEEANCDLCVTK